jgi:hypothetical protein
MKDSLLVVALLAGVQLTAQQPPPGAQERVAALKQSLEQNQARLRQYEWTETTTISLKGEQKSQKQNRCYYSADGKVQKVPIGDQSKPQQAPKGGRGGRVKQNIVENKKDEIQDYMKRAADLIQLYVPPNPDSIQKAKDAGRVSPQPLETGQSVRLAFKDYAQPGDSLSIDLDGAANRLVGVNVATYLDKPEDQVGLDVHFTALPDGTNYPDRTALDVKAKAIRVVVENSGYRHVQHDTEWRVVSRREGRQARLH